jgi:hypothetical protein
MATVHHQQHSSESEVVTPVHIEPDERSGGRYEVVEDGDAHRVLACGFSTTDAARAWVQNHNRVSGWHRLELHNA